MRYNEAIYETRRRKTREVPVGDVGVGGRNPVRIQSMTTSDTRNVEGTVEEIIRLADAGCEMARVAVQGKKEATSCERIKNTLVRKGYSIPLIADIHFYPPAALTVVEFVDKVRINPGNFADRRAVFRKKEYDDASYARELDRVEEVFSPLVEKSLALRKALRIGVNHGSLSDRIMNRYGDTPSGMVESALEFARICRKRGFHDLIFSMKSSNPAVMIEAYRLLTQRMYELGWDYPLHLGVTEAGLGLPGRIKSAVGTGTLLLDGLGDTIRVSLAEDSVEEIGPCRELVRLAEGHEGRGVPPFIACDEARVRKKFPRLHKVLHKKGSVFLHVPGGSKRSPCEYDAYLGEGAERADALYIEEERKIVSGSDPGEEPPRFSWIGTEKGDIESIDPSSDLFFLELKRPILQRGRSLFYELRGRYPLVPLILVADYEGSEESIALCAGAELGALLVEGIGDGLLLRTPLPPERNREISFNLLQACRMRMSQTELIACPSCGRTLFDLQETTKRIREKTAGFPGVKIGIMGCVVNGPGEMADADVGYVGSRPGKVDLYVGKQCVERGVDVADADQKLIDLIRSADIAP
ncbi:MAG: (E)-4-hydroxy-3-methylbut-2-enyl-diphosphate synthase [Simkaniaceae bacterium]|nr:(E)-4-hydroxy-3-methylbut-2-enyl-diphosphate synthase [Simkaniaceae bacterium]